MTFEWDVPHAHDIRWLDHGILTYMSVVASIDMGAKTPFDELGT